MGSSNLPGRMKIGRTPLSMLSAHRLVISNSASRLVARYLAGTSGRKASAAEMYTNEREGEGDEVEDEDEDDEAVVLESTLVTGTLWMLLAAEGGRDARYVSRTASAVRFVPRRVSADRGVYVCALPLSADMTPLP